MKVEVSPAYLDNVRVQFQFTRLRFTFTALDRLQFAAVIPANTLRGALGHALRLNPAHYARVFAPQRTGGPSGLINTPRPFVFRARQLNGLVVHPGCDFTFDMHIFDAPITPWLINAFAEIAKSGLGPHRSRIHLQSAEEEHHSVDLSTPTQDINTLKIEFLTPTELKIFGQIAEKPDFSPLIARARDRISELSSLYGNGALPIDFAAFGKRAHAITMTACECKTVSVSRVSSRTGQSHGLGGFIGWATYAGALTEFVPLLTAAQFTGVGRQTTWGKGEILCGQGKM